MQVSVIAHTLLPNRLHLASNEMATWQLYLMNQPYSFIDNGVTGELCLTSNLQTKAAPTIEDFPYLKMKAAGARISINTDNRTVSDTDLTKEYALYHQHFKTKETDFYQHNVDAIQASFASDEEKQELLTKLEKAYADYL